MLVTVTLALTNCPARRDDAWVKRHESFVAEAQRGHIDVLFVGDSIVDRWREDPPQGGRPIWERELAPLHAANFGMGGDRTQNLLWRLRHGELSGIQPKVVVVLIGTNHLNDEPNARIGSIVRGIRAVVDEIRGQLPRSQVLLLGLFPRGERPTELQRAQVAAVNRELATLAGDHVTFLDLGAKFLAPDGTFLPRVMPDGFHPSDRGYEIWAREMKPTLLRLMAESRD